MFTPVSARMFAEFAGLEARYVKGEASQLSVSQNGLWLRQGDEKQQSVIHALRVADQGEHLEDVIVFLYGANDHFIGRIDAKSGAAAGPCLAAAAMPGFRTPTAAGRCITTPIC